MKKFDFPLEKILSLRTFHEKKAEIALQKAVGERDALKLEIKDIDAKVMETSALFCEDVDMNVLFWAENYIKGLKAKKMQFEAMLVKLESKVRECLEKYQEALKKRKILDRLKDKKIEEWKKECEKEEIFTLDEAVSFKISLES